MSVGLVKSSTASILGVCGVTALGICSGAAQTRSTSKLSAHLISAYTSGSSNIVAGHPRVLKVLGLDSGFPSGMVQAMRDYKAQTPDGKVVVRVYSPRTYSLADDATASAGDFWTNILLKGLNALSSSDRALIDYLEGPNEGQTPTLGYPGSAPSQASQWFNQFWTNLTPRIVAAGFKPCIGSIAVGNPGGSVPQMQSYLAAFVPALRQAKAAGGAWSYHAYTIGYTTDVGTEIYYSLRYRQFYSYFAAAFPDLTAMPLVLSEGGVDATGDPSTSGWQARGSAANYQRWLNWFDQQLQQDPYVLGCTLFENGDPGGWSSFDLEPIAGWLESYLIAPASVPPAPTGVYASVGNGTVLLSWTNAPLNPTTYSVKRSTNDGGPYLTIATNLTAGVQATTYTDTLFAPNTTYLYVVSALNAFGESPDSVQVSARPTNGLPDVIVTAVSWTPANLFNGAHAIFSARVLNQGSAATPSGTILGVGFNVDGAGTASWSASYTAALAPNASVTLAADGGPSGVNYWSASAGAHTVTATVDDINRFPESNENNNATTVPFNVFAAGYAINSGGGAAGSFGADSNYAGSTNTLSVTNLIDSTGVTNPAPMAVYQNERWGDFAYALNNLVPGSNYTVRLHFAEISSSVNQPGERRFNVSLNGIQVLSDLDVLAAAGAKFRAVVREIKRRADTSGAILVQFSRGAANEAECNGIEVFGSAPPPPPQITSLSVADRVAYLTWQTSPATIYRVQYKTDLNETNWITLGSDMIASGNTLSVSNNINALARQFYRVVIEN